MEDREQHQVRGPRHVAGRGQRQTPGNLSKRRDEGTSRGCSPAHHRQRPGQFVVAKPGLNASAATLNNVDQLTASSGSGTLALYGSGVFRVDQLATFSGFSTITLSNYPYRTSAELYLGNQSVVVMRFGSGDIVYLGSGQTVVSGFYDVYSFSPSNWNSADVINGGTLILNTNAGASTYDLTGNTLQNIGELIADGDNITLDINSADAAGVSAFVGSGGANSHLVTSDLTLDLSHTELGSFTVLSTNTAGTIFTVRDVNTAFAILGGPGQDTIIASGFAFTADQRNAIFATASIEKIVDTSGMYTAPPPNPNLIQLTTGNDLVNSSSPNLVVNASAATLNNVDQLTASSGSGTLALYGSGVFRVDQLATFSGFSTITLSNYPYRTSAELYLGN